MKTARNFNIPSIILAATVSGGFVFPAFAEQETSYLVDLNTRRVTSPGTLGGNNSAWGINASGQAVGYSQSTASKDPLTSYFGHAFITGPNGVGMTDLGTLNGDYISFAFGINASGQVVGYSKPISGYAHAFITGPNGVGMTELGSLTETFSEAYGINDSGQAVGYSYTASGYRHAFMTGPNGADMTDLGTLGGNDSYATGINASGQVVGYSYTASGDSHAFITGPNGVGMTDLGGPTGGTSEAWGINDSGQVTGSTWTAANGNRAFITGPNGVGMVDLNSLVHPSGGGIFIIAHGINNMGQVSAIGVVPEPESYALLLPGLALIGFVARRKKMGVPSL